MLKEVAGRTGVAVWRLFLISLGPAAVEVWPPWVWLSGEETGTEKGRISDRTKSVAMGFLNKYPRASLVAQW